MLQLALVVLICQFFRSKRSGNNDCFFGYFRITIGGLSAGMECALALVVLYGAGTNLSGRVGAGWRIDLIVRLFSSPSADRLAVADRACRTALAEIDGEARTTILFPLNIADVDGLRRHSPEAKEDGRARECGGRGGGLRPQR